MTPSTGTSKPYSSTYRSDIDGLRSVAVLPVLLFHARLGCPGGFVGVDIFFVISGFLISSLIFKELDEGTFSLPNFWERRIRRILPALTAVILCTLVAGWCILLPEDFASFGKSISAQAALLSNLFFYWHTDYFTAGTDTKPLLHTWSLAVEEQFYLLFPLLLLLLMRFRRISRAKLIAYLTIASLALSIVGSYLCPSATFYVLPTRAWELLLGTLLVLARGRFPQNSQTKETIGWLGLGLVICSIFFIDETTRFPGIAAMFPCLGAALIIFSSENEPSAVGRILSLKPLAFIGLISYSLYLWHWPLLVFSTYPTGGLIWKFRAFLLVISIILAALSWKYIETPFRTRRVFQNRAQIFWFAGISMSVGLAFGLLIHHYDGIPSRIPSEIRTKVLNFASSKHRHPLGPKTSLTQALAGQFVELGSQETNTSIHVMVWGDSHASAVAPVLDDLCHKFSKRGVLAYHNGTAPVLDHVSTAPFSLKEHSPAFNQAVLSFIAQKHIANVILVARWSTYPASDSFKARLISTAQMVMKSGCKLYILKEVPKQDFDVPRFAAFTTMHGGDLDKLGVTKEKHSLLNAAFLQTFSQMALMGAVVLDPSDYFLNHNGLYGAVHNDQILYSDINHLSLEGSRLLYPLFESIFTQTSDPHRK